MKNRRKTANKNKTEWKSNHIQHLTRKRKRKNGLRRPNPFLETLPKGTRPAVRAVFPVRPKQKNRLSPTLPIQQHTGPSRKNTHISTTQNSGVARRGTPPHASARTSGQHNILILPGGAPPSGSSARKNQTTFCYRKSDLL